MGRLPVCLLAVLGCLSVKVVWSGKNKSLIGASVCVWRETIETVEIGLNKLEWW